MNDFTKFFQKEQGSSKYQDWEYANPGEAARWYAARAAALAGSDPGSPKMRTEYGQSLIDAAVKAYSAVDEVQEEEVEEEKEPEKEDQADAE